LAQKLKASIRERCPDEQTYTGKYRNRVFGFSIIIPPRLTGYWNSARCVWDEENGCLCMNDHGRFIPLADNAHIEAFVGWEMEEGWSAKDYENEELSNLRTREGITQLKVIRSNWTRLGRLRARRFVVQFTEKDRSTLIDHLIALSGGVEYELILHTSPERYQQDQRQLEKVISSWRSTRRI